MTPDELAQIVADKVLAILAQQPKQAPTDAWFTVDELIKYLPDHPAKQTVYQWTSTHAIPFHKRKGQRALYFKKSEIDTWLNAGRRKTISEIKGK